MRFDLGLVYRQSYGKVVTPEADDDMRRRVYRGNKREAPATGDLLEPVSWDVLNQLSPTLFLNARDKLSVLLAATFGWLRHDVYGPYNPHRSYPSARCVFSVRPVVAIRPTSTEAWAYFEYVPDWHMLAQTTRLPKGLVNVVETRGQEENFQLACALVVDLTRVPLAYGALRWALAILEAGHVLYNLGIVAVALGWKVHIEPVLIPETPPDASRLCVAMAVVDGEFEPCGNLLAFEGGVLPIGDLFWQRSAGHGLVGLAPAVRIAERDAIADASKFLRWGVDMLGPWLKQAGIRWFVVCERVRGSPPGIYAVEETGVLSPVAEGRYLAELQEAFLYPPEALNIRALNCVWLGVVDYPALYDRYGSEGFVDANLALGWQAQGVSLAHARHRMFARPARSFDEQRLDQLLPLNAGEQVAYQVLAGFDSFDGVWVDLRLG